MERYSTIIASMNKESERAKDSYADRPVNLGRADASEKLVKVQETNYNFYQPAERLEKIQ